MTIIHQNSKIAGRFMIERCQRAPDGSEIPGSREVVAPWQDNLITDSGLDNLGGSNFMARCRIGAGNTAPSVSDTVLVSQLAVSTSGQSQIDSGPRGDDFVSVVGTYTFPPGAGTGVIAEIGVAPPSGQLTTRALIRDENGDPTTITKGPIDELTVTYQMREYPDQSDTVQQVTNPHTSETYEVTTRTYAGREAGRLYSWHGSGPITSHPSQNPRAHASPLDPWDAAVPTSSHTGATSVNAYEPGSHYRDAVFTFSEGIGNISGGIVRVTTGTGEGGQYAPFRIQAAFNPPIDKDNTKTLRITLRKSWGRYAP